MTPFKTLALIAETIADELATSAEVTALPPSASGVARLSTRHWQGDPEDVASVARSMVTLANIR